MVPSSSAADERILSYHDEILYRSDLETLAPTNFVNDRIISFFSTHLSLSLSSDAATLLLPPSLSYLISIAPDPQILAPLDLPSKTLILFPINNNDDPSVANGGTHWSLLVYNRDSNEFVHHDSLINSRNGLCALRLCMGVKRFVGGNGEYARYVEGKTPQQSNGYDCGVFVMAIAKAVCEWKEGKKGSEKNWFRVLEEEVDSKKVEEMRGEITRLILSLMEKK